MKAAALNARRPMWKRNIPLILMFAPVLLYFVIFKYLPMGGLIIAFKEYNLRDGIWGSPWVGTTNFEMLYNSPNMFNVIKSTFILSVLSTFVGFPFPIMLAILINEVRRSFFKKAVQTLVYLPHFLNWVIVGSFVVLIFAQEHGIMSSISKALTGESYPFLYEKSSWLTIFLGAGIWKEAGFSAIIYLAALSTIDPSLYESASIDGATKWRQMWHITLPGIAPVVALMLILAMDNVMNIGFDQVYVLGNPVVSDLANVISVWSYRIGLGSGQFSLTTALGLFQSLIGLLLVLIANRIARRFGQSLW
ncbi:ABC transporter permease [Paenibacillus koleovorans]|uniref:ABC transporter permease n=1 Tax=Paenibacillus koleovorans TaxID=121608 RepID=UPI000FD8E5A4|nr:ABC transporter permease subunit [Paenibacillus koleovorans]